MAGLHNFSQREQKESEGKWKARKGGGMLLVREEIFFFFSLIFLNWLKEGRSANEKTC